MRVWSGGFNLNLNSKLCGLWLPCDWKGPACLHKHTLREKQLVSNYHFCAGRWDADMQPKEEDSRLDRGGASPPGKACCAEDLEPKAWRSESAKSSGERRICFNDKNTGWNTVITESFCNVDRWIADSAYPWSAGSSISIWKTKMYKEVQPEAERITEEEWWERRQRRRMQPVMNRQLSDASATLTLYKSTRSHEEHTASFGGVFFVSLHWLLQQQKEVRLHRSDFHTDSLESFKRWLKHLCNQ